MRIISPRSTPPASSSSSRVQSSRSRIEHLAVLASLCALGLALTGCTVSTLANTEATSSALPQIAGRIQGGQQPVSGATIQLYAANTSLTQGASTALITSTVKSGADGSFTITGDYTCPAPGALVYAVATGGNPGLSGSVNNTALALVTVLGTCGTLTSSTFISLNELTTVAAVEALAPFMLDYAHVGTNATNVAGLTTAFTSAVGMVDPSTGQLRGTSASGIVLPSALLNTLADILAACVNSPGGRAGDGTVCGKLLQYTSTTTDTVAALLSIVHAPETNAASLFALVPAGSPFQPTLGSAPASLVAPVSLPLVMSAAYDHSGDELLTDKQGHIWLLQPIVGTVTQYDTNLNLLHTFNVDKFPIGTPNHMVLDPQDNLLVPFGLALLKIDSNGNTLSPPTGYPLSQNGVSLFTRPLFTSDAYGNIWVLVIRNSDSAFCLAEYSGTGTLISPATGYCGSQKMSQPTQPERVFADTLGNVYLPFLGTAASTPLEVFSSSGSYRDLPSPLFEGLYGYSNAIFEPRYQHLWATNEFILYDLNLDGTGNFSSTAANTPLGILDGGITVDGAGNFWVGTQFGPAAYSPTGTILFGCLSYVACSPVDPLYDFFAGGIAVDPAGDVFVVDYLNAALLKFTGLGSVK